MGESIEMKNGILIIACFLLFAGCSNIDSSSKKNQKNEISQSSSKQDSLSLKADYFDKIKNVNGKNVIQNPTNLLVLINKSYSFPDG